jgi:hypothetical protein
VNGAGNFAPGTIFGLQKRVSIIESDLRLALVLLRDSGKARAALVAALIVRDLPL